MAPTESSAYNFDLQILLQTSPGGNSILRFYETRGCLDFKNRNQLVDIIIKHMYSHIVLSGIKYEEYNILAAKITTLFPKETTGTYFTNPIKKRDSLNGRSIAARGKLVDKVRNLLYKHGDRRRESTNTENYISSNNTDLDLEDLASNVDVLWLKQNSEPWDEVLQKWRNTFHLRRESKCSNVHDFLLQWNTITDARGETLINLDFDLLYPDKGLNLYLNWDTFFATLLELRPTKDAKILQILEDLHNTDDDVKLAAQIELLGRLVPPRGRLSKNIKFTTQESIDSIFILAKTAGDIDAIITEQKRKACTNQMTVQPYIILQGTLLSCSAPLLVIDNVTYKFQSIKKAFDILFKSYHILDARYPRAGDHLYLIIQRCVYKIQTKYDNVVSYISNIVDH